MSGLARHLARAVLRSVALLVAALVLLVLVWLQSDTRVGLGQQPTLVEQLARIGMWLYLGLLVLAVAVVAWRRVRRPSSR